MQSLSRMCVATSAVAAMLFCPLKTLADNAPIQQTTPVPSATNLISTRVPEQTLSPILITKTWQSIVKGRCREYAYLFHRLICTSFAEYPIVHWNFKNNGDKVATAIRFQITEVSAFGETVLGTGLTSDLTGTFSPGVSIESRANYNVALRGDGTHWEIRVLKVLWSDGSVWDRGNPLPSSSSSPVAGTTPIPATQKSP